MKIKILIATVFLYIFTQFLFCEPDPQVPYRDPALILSRLEELKDGDTLIINEGIYRFADSLEIKALKGVTIKGEGEVWILCRDVYQDVLFISECEKLTIKNLHLRHEEPLDDYECQGAVISIFKSDDIRLFQCEMNGCGAIGVSVYNSNNVIVENCLIHQNSFTAFYVSAVKNMLIRGNKVMNNGSYIERWDTEDLAVFDNKNENNNGYGESDPDTTGE
ncbi:MAG: right-handed parallel beta-helix repeat-containing protein [Spirochaetales bacterium]|nr:right-handed parallel beta-helix repeat-containing protein [Spirochaetales bacterium]